MLPETVQRMPMNDTSVTVALSRPMLMPSALPVKRPMSSWMRWSGLSGTLAVPLCRNSSRW